jgi:hypothetical protein
MNVSTWNAEGIEFYLGGHVCMVLGELIAVEHIRSGKQLRETLFVQQDPLQVLDGCHHTSTGWNYGSEAFVVCEAILPSLTDEQLEEFFTTLKNEYYCTAMEGAQKEFSEI